MTGNDFVGGRCYGDDLKYIMQQGICLGVAVAVNELEAYLPKNIRACFPDGVPYGQAVRIVSKYLNDHPEMLQKNLTFLVIAAFHEAFPCKK